MAKRSKYAHVIDKLPRYPGDDPDRIEVINAMVEMITAQQSMDDPGVNVDDLSLAELMEHADDSMKQVIELIKRSAPGQPHGSDYAAAYATARKVRDKIKTWDTALGVLLEAYQRLITDQFEVEGVTSLRLSNGQLVSTWFEPYVTVEDKERFRQWCVQNGYSRQMVLHSSTTSSMVKQRLEVGEAEPPGVKAYGKPVIRLGSE